LTAVPGDNAIDGNTPTAADMDTALQKLSNTYLYPLSLVMDGGHNTTYSASIISFCESRGDCIGILSSSTTDENLSTSSAAATAVTTHSFNSPYAAMFSPHIVRSVQNGRDLIVPPDGVVAANISKWFIGTNKWKAKAGLLRGAINETGLNVYYDSTDTNTLVDGRVNPIIFVQGQGLMIWGNKTLQTRNTIQSRLHAMLLITDLTPRVKSTLQQYLFDLNNESTRLEVVSVIEAIFRSYVAEGGLYDYKVVADASNNTSADLLAGRMNIGGYIAIQKDITEINFELILSKVDSSFQLII